MDALHVVIAHDFEHRIAFESLHALGVVDLGDVDDDEGMGPTLLVADETNSYVLADRGTAQSFRRKLHIVPLLADTPELRNVYSVVRLDTKRHPEIAAAEADELADWLEGPAAERLIANFKVGGESLFHSMTPGR